METDGHKDQARSSLKDTGENAHGGRPSYRQGQERAVTFTVAGVVHVRRAAGCHNPSAVRSTRREKAHQ